MPRIVGAGAFRSSHHESWPGSAHAEQWAVLADDLGNGAQVVVNAARSLAEGLRVEPINANPARARAAGAGTLPGAGR